MAMRIESKVADAAKALATAGVAGDRAVIMTVLDPEDEVRLAELRAAIAEGDDSGPGQDARTVFEGIEADLKARSASPRSA